jgi:hypothetical protein
MPRSTHATASNCLSEENFCRHTHTRCDISSQQLHTGLNLHKMVIRFIAHRRGTYDAHEKRGSTNRLYLHEDQATDRTRRRALQAQWQQYQPAVDLRPMLVRKLSVPASCRWLCDERLRQLPMLLRRHSIRHSWHRSECRASVARNQDQVLTGQHSRSQPI